MRTLLGCMLALLSFPGIADVQDQPACHYPYRVGYQVTEVAGLKVAIWYPTLAAPSTFAYSSDFDGFVAQDAAPACGPLPLVVFSHGLGGCGTQSLFFTEELARNGYVVAAPDHKDATFCTVDGGKGEPGNATPEQPFNDPAAWSDQTYLDREADLEVLIDALVAGAQFGPVIDPNAIGAAGHSLGGYSVLGLAGAWTSWKDPRIKAVLAFSPYIEPFTLHATLGNLGVPVMYQGAQFDVGVTPTLEGPQGAYAQTGKPKYFAKLHGGTHLVWTNSACADTGSVQSCLANPCNPAIIDRYAVAFLDAYLKARTAPVLTGNGVGLADYRFAR